MFASLNVLAPTSAITIVINAVLAKIYFDENLSFLGYVGSILIIVGCVLSIIFGTHSQDELKVANLFNKAYSYKFVLFTTIHGSFCVFFGIFASTMFTQNVSNTKSNRNGISIQNENNRGDENRDLINTDDIAFDENDEDDQKLDELPVNQNIDEADDRPLITPDETSAIIPKSKERQKEIKRDEYKHIIRAFMMAFATAGLVAWGQFLGMI